MLSGYYQDINIVNSVSTLIPGGRKTALWSMASSFSVSSYSKAYPTAQPHYNHIALGPCELLGLLVEYTIVTGSAKTIHFCIFYTSLDKRVTLLLPT